MHRRYLMGDTVKYVGSSVKGLNRKGNAWGVVVGYVRNAKENVIEFADGDYIVPEEDLAPYVFTEKEKGPEVVRLNKKWDD